MAGEVGVQAVGVDLSVELGVGTVTVKGLARKLVAAATVGDLVPEVGAEVVAVKGQVGELGAVVVTATTMKDLAGDVAKEVVAAGLVV
ncbi:unnamed protein product [Linum trigynum]